MSVLVLNEAQMRQVANAMAGWWAQKLEPKVGNTAKATRGMDKPAGGLLAAMQMMRAANEGSGMPDNALENFRQLLADKVMVRLREPRSMFHLDTDYVPESQELCDAAKEAGVPFSRFPMKTGVGLCLFGDAPGVMAEGEVILDLSHLVVRDVATG